MGGLQRRSGWMREIALLLRSDPSDLMKCGIF